MVRKINKQNNRKLVECTYLKHEIQEESEIPYVISKCRWNNKNESYFDDQEYLRVKRRK